MASRVTPHDRPALLGRMNSAEFIALVASLMALNALAIDVMLPALRDLAVDLSVTSANQQQLVVIIYVIGFSVPQIIFGPLADRFGRRPTVLASLAGYALAGLLCFMAPSFETLLLARLLQGVFAAGCRVAAVSIVRDLFEGRAMARVMSLVMTVFMIVPILAPALGQSVLLWADWRVIFLTLTLAGAGVLLWAVIRLPESLPVDQRRPLSLSSSIAAYGKVLAYPVTRGYLLASGFIFGALFTFIASSEQVLREVFNEADRFFIWFGLVALGMCAASLTNARLVERFGMRQISHLALVGFTVLSALLWCAMAHVGLSFTLFFPVFLVIFALFGLIGANFNALAMQPLGDVAGTGSAAYGFVSTTLSAVIGWVIGSSYDGTVGPLLGGFTAIGVVTLLTVIYTEFNDKRRHRQSAARKKSE